MATTSNRQSEIAPRFKPLDASPLPTKSATSGSQRFRSVPINRTAPSASPNYGTVPAVSVGIAERRRRRRVHVLPMYSLVLARILSRKTAPIEAHVLNLSETGMAIEADSLIPVGEVITIEFRIAGVGRLSREQWPEFAAIAEVVRHDNLDDFPLGSYRIALRFGQVPTMTQAQISRFVATQMQ